MSSRAGSSAHRRRQGSAHRQARPPRIARGNSRQPAQGEERETGASQPPAAPEPDHRLFGRLVEGAAWERLARRHKAVFAIVLALLIVVLALLPSVLRSVVKDLRAQIPGTYQLAGIDTNEATTHSRLHLSVVGLDQWAGTVTLNVSGTHVCLPPCTWDDRILFVAAQRSTQGVEGLPAFQAVTLPTTATEVTQVITLPIDGRPLRFPIDSYELRLGVIVQRVLANGTVQLRSPDEVRGHLFLSLQSHLPQLVMDRPKILDPANIRIPDSSYQYSDVALLTFTRPPYQQALAALLLLLVAGAAAYSVFSRQLGELVTGVGTLVLGVWGVRAILVGTGAPGITLIDLILSGVILFMLIAIAIRVLHEVARRSRPRLTRTRGQSQHAQSDRL